MRVLAQWISPAPRKAIVVGVADMSVSDDASAEIVTYSLGSCLGISIYDPLAKVGGLLHIMLPTSTIDPIKAAAKPFMFVDTGVRKFFHAAYGLGADRKRLVIKVAGGAQLLDPGGLFNIGARNFQALDEILAKNGFIIFLADVGGVASRTMRLDLATGNVTIKSPGSDPYLL